MLIRYILVLKLAFHSIAELIPFKVGLLLDSNDEAESNAIKRLADFTISTMYWTLQLEVQYHDQTYLSMMGGVCSLIDQDVAAIISASDSSSTAIQSNLIGQFQIPFIAAVATNPFMETPYVNNMELRLSPTDVHQSEAVYALLKEFLWFDFSILASSDSFGIRSTVRLQYLASQDIEFHIKDIQNFDTKRDLSQPSDVKVFSKELEVIKDSLVRVIVLSCHGRFAKRIFSEAKEMGLMAKDYIWITLDGVTARPDTLTHGDRSYLSYYKGIFGTTPHYGKDSGEYSDLKDAYVLNGGVSTDLTRASVKVSEGLKLIHFSLVRLGDIERETLKEVRCGKLNTWGAGQQLYSNMKKDFSGRQINSITGIEHFPTYEIMNFKSDGFERVGFWTYETGLLDSVGQKVKWRSRKDLTFIGSDTHPPTGLGSLEGYHLRIGIVEYPPTTYFVNSLECEKDPSRPRCWYGWSPEIFTRLAEDLKFTYEYAVAPTKMVGGTSESDSWSGSGTLMGDIIDRKTDITIPISMTYNRAKHVDFTAPLHEDSAALAMHPAIGSFASSANIFFFLDPFEMSVWGTILLLIFGIAILTNFFSKFSPLGTYGEKLHAMKTCPCKKCVLRRRVKKVVKCQVDEGEEDDGMNDLSIYNSNWLIAAGFVLQGVDVLPTSPSGRILLLTWWLFIMIISAMYTANLTASLTVESAVKTINNFNDLLSQEYYEWGALEGDLLSSQLKNSTEEEHRDIYTRGKKIITTDVAAKKVKEGRFVFVGPRTLLEFVLKDDCEKIVVDTASYQNQWAFAVPFHAPYLKPINKMFITYTEEGYFTQGFERWKSGEEGGETCPVESDEIGSDTTFTPQLLAGLFIILAGAVGCSLTICCLEFLFVAYLDSRKGKGFCECLGTRIYLKKCEVMEEWFGLDRGKSAKNNIIFYNPDGTDDKAIEVPHSSGSNRSPYHYANSNGGMISHRALTTQDRPFTEEGNFILKQKDLCAYA